MARYLRQYKVEQMASAAYDYNLRLGQALIPILHTVEVVVRNRIHSRLVATTGKDNWWDALPQPEFDWMADNVLRAKSSLLRRQERVTADKLVAELTFGCWTQLFNARHTASMWGPLSKAFTRLPKRFRQRRTVAGPLNRVRELRNRVMHHEPLLWLSPSVMEVHADMMNLLNWIEPQVQPWLCTYDTVPAVWKEFQEFDANQAAA